MAQHCRYMAKPDYSRLRSGDSAAQGFLRKTLKVAGVGCVDPFRAALGRCRQYESIVGFPAFHDDHIRVAKDFHSESLALRATSSILSFLDSETRSPRSHISLERTRTPFTRSSLRLALCGRSSIESPLTSKVRLSPP